MSDGVKVNNLPAFDAKVMAWFAAVEKATAEVAVGLALAYAIHTGRGTVSVDEIDWLKW